MPAEQFVPRKYVEYVLTPFAAQDEETPLLLLTTKSIVHPKANIRHAARRRIAQCARTKIVKAKQPTPASSCPLATQITSLQNTHGITGGDAREGHEVV